MAQDITIRCFNLPDCVDRALRGCVTQNMTWTLRFYDDAGVEIGYVEKPDKYTYSVGITHPASGWAEFKSKLESYERLILDSPDVELQEMVDEVLPGAIIDSGPMLDQLPPQAHLREVQTSFSHPDVADSKLADE